MESRTMTLARIRELDERCDEETRKFLQLGPAYGDLPPFFLHDEYAGRLPEMAKNFGVSPEEFEIYVWVRGYIYSSTQTDCEELPPPKEIAQQLGIPFEEFNAYLLWQMKLIHDAFVAEEDEEFALHIEPEEWDLRNDS